MNNIDINTLIKYIPIVFKEDLNSIKNEKDFYKIRLKWKRIWKHLFSMFK